MELLFSVVIPAYNAEKTVRTAVDSVLCQTYRDFEVIIIDDCSSDGTYNILLEYSNRDERVKVYRNEENIGVSEARNLGVSLARGEYAAFLDSDDAWRPDKLEKQAELIKRHPECPLVFTGVSHMDGEGEPYGYVLSVPESVDYKNLLRQNVIICSSAAAKRSLLLKYPMKCDDMHEDFAVWLQILRYEGDARAVNEPLIIYRVSPGTKSSNKLKSGVMAWRAYKSVGLNFFQRTYYIAVYAVRGIKKYKSIRSSK